MPPVLISQRLNVCYRDVRLAVTNRQDSVIVDLAREQHEGGAVYLDLCAAGLPDECESLAWMVGAVQREIDCPLVIDSADAATLLHTFGLCARPPIVNSVSVSMLRAGHAHDLMRLPARAFIVSTYDPETSNTHADRIHALREVISGGIQCDPSMLIADPLFYPHRYGPHRWEESCQVAREIRNAWPDIGLICAIGNVTFQTEDRDWSHGEVAERALVEGFNWILCDVTRLGSGARATSRGTG